MSGCDRRLFLKSTGIALVAGGFLPRVFVRMASAAETSASRRTLVVIFQRGAVDGLNVLVPHGDSAYYAARPTIAVPRPGSSGRPALDLDGFFGLHPSLAALVPHFRDRSAAFVHAVGSPDATRSHFDAQDFMDSAAPGDKSVHDGWLDRVARQIPGDDVMQLVALASRTPRSVLGPNPELVLQDLSTFSVKAGSGSATWSDEADRLLRGMHANGTTPVYDSGREVFSAIDRIKSTPALQSAPANGAVYPGGTAGSGLRQAAQLIRADIGTRAIYVNVPGSFDTHANQLAANNQEYPNLAAALVAFRRDLGSRIDDVLLMVTTEFGRTAAQNGSQGTDHGYAHCGIFLGGGVHGGRVHGSWPGLSASALNEGRDLRYTVDFRDVFAAAARWLGVSDTSQVIPNYTPATDPGIFS
jgi:uncharacterized protein (DUF1501 family)